MPTHRGFLARPVVQDPPLRVQKLEAVEVAEARGDVARRVRPWTVLRSQPLENV